MQRKRQWPIAVVVTLGFGVITGLLITWLRPREPVYAGKPVSYWADHLSGSEFGRSYDAIRAIGPKAVRPLLAKVRAIHSVRQRAYAAAWLKLPPRLQKQLPAPKQPRDLDEKIIRALSLLASNDVPAVVTAFADRNSNVRRAAVLSIGRMLLTEEVAAQSVPGLTRLLVDSDPGVRAAALDTLERMESDAQEAVPTLIQTIQNPKMDGAAVSGLGYRAAAVRLLGHIGPPAESAISAITALLHDSDSTLRSQAAIALWRIHPDTNLAAILAPELDRSGSALAPEIVTVLGEMGSAAKESVPALVRSLENPQVGSLMSANSDLLLSALKKIDPPTAAKIEGKRAGRIQAEFIQRQLEALRHAPANDLTRPWGDPSGFALTNRLVP